MASRNMNSKSITRSKVSTRSFLVSANAPLHLEICSMLTKITKECKISDFESGHKHLRSTSSDTLRDSFINSFLIWNKTVICKVVTKRKMLLNKEIIRRTLTTN